MRRSSYQERQEINRAIAKEAIRNSSERFCLDITHVALHKLGWGYKRIKRFNEMWVELYNHYGDALTGSAESDVLQEHLDNEIKDIVKDNEQFIPFKDRYEWISQDKYKPRHHYHEKR